MFSVVFIHFFFSKFNVFYNFISLLFIILRLIFIIHLLLFCTVCINYWGFFYIFSFFLELFLYFFLFFFFFFICLLVLFIYIWIFFFFAIFKLSFSSQIWHWSKFLFSMVVLQMVKNARVAIVRMQDFPHSGRVNLLINIQQI